MKSKRLTLDAILEKSSASFRRLNPSPRGKIPGPGHGPVSAPGPVAAPASDSGAQRPGACESLEAARADGRCTEGGADRPLVTFTLFRVRPLDAESKFASVKYLLDALRYAKLLTDDKDRDIRLNVHQFRVDAYRKEATGITIDYP